MSDKLTTRLAVPELASVGTPSSGFQYFYAKPDGYMYAKNSAGIETKIKSYSMQDIYDNTLVVSSAKTVNLDATIPTVHKKTRPATGFQFVHKWTDENDGYMGSLFYDSVTFGLCLDAGQSVSANSFLATAAPTFQGIASRGTQAAPEALVSGDATCIFQGWARRSGGGLNYGARMLTCVSEDPTSTNAGTEIYWDVVKNGTPASSMYSAMRLTNDGNLKIFKDFLARSTYKVPFMMYVLPSPYNMTGSATETKISSDISVPPNTLSSNSKLKTDILTSCTTTANGKYVIVRFGPNANNTDPVMLYFNFGGNYGMHIFDTLTCRNSDTNKIGLLSWTSGSIGTSSISKSIAMQSISVDNTVQNYITIWMKNGQTTDNSTIESFSIEVLP